MKSIRLIKVFHSETPTFGHEARPPTEPPKAQEGGKASKVVFISFSKYLLRFLSSDFFRLPGESQRIFLTDYEFVPIN